MRQFRLTSSLGILILATFLMSISPVPPADAQVAGNNTRLTAEDLFDLQYATDPRISLDGRRVVYVRQINDVMIDDTRGNLWIAGTDGAKRRS